MSKKKEPEDTLNIDKEKELDPSEGAEKNAAEGGADDGGKKQEDGASETAGSKEDEELNAKYLRLAADFQNYKRRVEKERSDIYAYANEKLVVELLDVIDNFERALEHSGENESFAEGMNMIFKQFKGVLEKSGVEEIIATGEPFDPNYHHAVLTGSSAEHESGNVIQVLQKGYLLNKKVIRPSMVKVAE